MLACFRTLSLAGEPVLVCGSERVLPPYPLPPPPAAHKRSNGHLVGPQQQLPEQTFYRMASSGRF